MKDREKFVEEIGNILVEAHNCLTTASVDEYHPTKRYWAEQLIARIREAIQDGETPLGAILHIALRPEEASETPK